ncbi:MAG: GNAT family N-acetyltransferase [Thermoflexales bacterium]|nr:GNAT family N-acetyltransferase [Thermoflexales bacterium]
MSSLNKFDIQIAHSVQEIGPAAWDHLAAGRPFGSYRWYRFGETVRGQDLPTYIVLSCRGEPLACGAFWLTRQEPLPISPRPVRCIVEALVRRWPLLICRSPLTDTCGLMLPGLPLREAALRIISQVALEQARAARASFVIFDYLAQSTSLELSSAEAFAPISIANPGTSLAITWPDFDSYLNQLSYKTRKNYRRNCRIAQRLGIEIQSYSRVEAVHEALTLIRNVERRHNETPVPWMQRMLENAPMVDMIWLAAAIGEQLVGCELLLGDGDEWLVTAIGLDYRVQYAYFMLGYADIRCAIEHGVQRLRWGSCAYEFKQRMGFQLEDNNAIVFAASNRLLGWIARHLATS